MYPNLQIIRIKIQKSKLKTQKFSLKLKILKVLTFPPKEDPCLPAGRRLRRRLVVLIFSSRGESSLVGDF